MSEFKTFPIEELRHRFRYDPESGHLYYKAKIKGARFVVGSAAGFVSNQGYMVINLSDSRFAVHRVVWALHHGKWPEKLIDHINGIKTDNRIANLREVTNFENNLNFGRRNGYKTKGISPTRNGKWRAYYVLHGKQFHVGTFAEQADALRAYQAAAKKAQGEFYRELDHHGE